VVAYERTWPAQGKVLLVLCLRLVSLIHTRCKHVHRLPAAGCGVQCVVAGRPVSEAVGALRRAAQARRVQRWPRSLTVALPAPEEQPTKPTQVLVITGPTPRPARQSPGFNP
jgi:hypothetical protein